jgi:uncharacterized membrane protein HdeD (DUF308 family)
MAADPAPTAAAPEPLKALHASGWLLIAVGAISIVAGILALVYPEITLLALGLIAGINVLLLGVLALVDAVAGEGGAGARILVGMLGVLGVLGGIVMMRRPGETVLVIVLVLGLWLILSGVTEAIVALSEPADRGVRLLAALADFVIGILILALPKVSLATVAVLVAIAFLIRGVFAVYVGWHARKATVGLAEMA